MEQFIKDHNRLRLIKIIQVLVLVLGLVGILLLMIYGRYALGILLYVVVSVVTSLLARKDTINKRNFAIDNLKLYVVNFCENYLDLEVEGYELIQNKKIKLYPNTIPIISFKYHKMEISFVEKMYVKDYKNTYEKEMLFSGFIVEFKRSLDVYDIDKIIDEFRLLSKNNIEVFGDVLLIKAPNYINNTQMSFKKLNDNMRKYDEIIEFIDKVNNEINKK